MQIQALKVISHLPTDLPCQCAIKCEQPSDIDILKKQSSPAVYVVRNHELEHFSLFKNSIIDRGKKDSRKPLSKLLLHYEKVPLIRGTYKDTAQFMRSCRTLLGNALREGEANIYFIGVDDTIFQQLLGKLISQSCSGKSAETDKKIKQLTRHQFDDELSLSSQQLLDLLPKYEVPDSLLNSYLGESVEVRLVRQLIIRASMNDNPVLILGESGTGKEIVAHAIHDNSSQSKKGGKLFPVNCGAISPSLFESELFGHVKGAFTDAAYNKDGLWKAAGWGTLFLDEIGDLTPDHQVKILRALQEGNIRPVGATRSVKVNARIIAATNRDLFTMVHRGLFREDLYYRLRSFLIHTPALRQHPDDVPLLAQNFWKKITKDSYSWLPEEICNELKKYYWRGNGRELKMVLTNLYMLFGKEKPRLEYLRAVCRLQGHGVVQQKPSSEKEFNLQRREYLRHLNRVDELLGAIKVTLRPILQEGKTHTLSVSFIRAAVKNHIDELEALCSCPGLFRSAKVLDLVVALFNSLKQFSRRLSKNTGDTKATGNMPLCWRKEVANTYKKTQTAIFQEMENLLTSPNS
ncbi:MAG: sigma-54-dependent Fis family transcriptional regulator [Deltaproteobacteria bacterium]|nr:sigma-54-dependent Fis family transcriptional regulator [Deltaproteobacteria bacterium]